MSDRRRPARDLHLSLHLGADISDWQAGQAFLEPLFADRALAPARVSSGNEVSARHGKDVGTAEECSPSWGQRVQVRAQGRVFEAVEPFHWKGGRPADAKGWVLFSQQTARGAATRGTIGVQARVGVRVDWHGLLVAWCAAFQPESGLLHPCVSRDEPGPPVNRLDCTPEEEVLALAWTHYRSASLRPRFRAGPLTTVVEGLTNLGWATWFGPDLAHHVDAPGLRAAGFPVDRIGAGWLVRLSERVEDMAGDFARFASLRTRARALFQKGVFLLPADAGTGKS